MIEQSIIHKNTELSVKSNNSKGLYYNSMYELENFINVNKPLTDDSDPYHSLNDPIVNGFKIFFHFSSKVGLLADEEFTNSALAYLKRIGQNERYELLKLFIYQLSRLSTESQWLFQEISGIDNLLGMPFGQVNKEYEVNVKTLETIDNKVLRLLMLYREIAYDQNRDVWILPVNLRRFSMSVYIYDIRVFDSTSTLAVNNVRTKFTENIDEINHVLIDCGKCEFQNTSGADYFSNINNNNTEANTNSISILCGQAYISSMFKQLATYELANNIDVISSPSSENKKSNKWVEMLKKKISSTDLYRTINDQYDFLTSKDSWKSALDRVGENAMSKVVDLVHNRLGQLYLGNVFGFGMSDLARLGTSGSLTYTAQVAKIVDSTTQSLKQPPKRDNLGNVNE